MSAFYCCGLILCLHNCNQLNKIIDAETGDNIEFATIQWKGLNASTYTNGTTTNRKGIAKLSASSNQKLMLMVSYVGYQTITDTITANGKRYTIRLLPESTELADVVVFGKTKAQVLRESPEAVSVINAKELQGRSISLETVLNKTIGLKVGQTGGLGSIRELLFMDWKETAFKSYGTEYQ